MIYLMNLWIIITHQYFQITQIEMPLDLNFSNTFTTILATSEQLFDTYNQFYCAVSGSIVSPKDLTTLIF